MRAAAIVLAVVVVGLGLLFAAMAPTPAERAEPTAASAMLRQKVLGRGFLDGGTTGEAGAARAVVMDWHVGSGVATLVAFDDGTTSLYLSSGGAILGAGAHDAVQRAAAPFRAEGAKVAAQLKPVTEYPLTPSGTSTFYVITDSATLSSGPIAGDDLARRDHPLSQLARLAQDVITQIRKAT